MSNQDEEKPLAEAKKIIEREPYWEKAEDQEIFNRIDQITALVKDYYHKVAV